MIEEAIILAGGLGTRLRDVVPDLPKCMAPVSGKPFLQYLIDHYEHQGIRRFIFSLGYKFVAVEEFLEQRFRGSHTSHVSSIESEPLGTGGAVRRAAGYAESNNLLVLNGDTFFGINLEEVSDAFDQKEADCLLCLKAMKDFSRYGVVRTDADGRIDSFQEKKYYAEGLINGGAYALNLEHFMAEDLPEKCSFEKDYLEKYYREKKFYGLEQPGYFIDIGIPEDYQKADSEFVHFPFKNY